MSDSGSLPPPCCGMGLPSVKAGASTFPSECAVMSTENKNGERQGERKSRKKRWKVRVRDIETGGSERERKRDERKREGNGSDTLKKKVTEGRDKKKE